MSKEDWLSSLTCSVETSTEKPFVIQSVSDSWCAAWGYDADEVVGVQSIAILNGDGYDKHASSTLVAQFGSTVRCTNVTKDGRRLAHDAVLTQQQGRILCVSSNFELVSEPLSGLVHRYEDECRQGQIEAEKFGMLALDEARAEEFQSMGEARADGEDLWHWQSELQSTGQTVPFPRVSSTEWQSSESEPARLVPKGREPPKVVPRCTELNEALSELRRPKTRVGVNGFGRIGRQVVRIIALARSATMSLCHINATMDPEYMAYLLKHDTVHGKFPGTCEAVAKGQVLADGSVCESAGLLINGRFVSVSCTRAAEAIPWEAARADYVCESTGAFLTADACAAHLKGGAKKVVISAPAKDDAVPVIVVGVNEASYDPSSMHVVSNASCTTNGLAPLVKLIHEKFGIKQGLMTTVHATTASQSAVDSSAKKDWRAGRAASTNIIPAATGAAKAVAKCYPQMKGRLTGVAVRVPVVDVSMVDLTCELEAETTYDEIKAEVKLAAETYAKGIVGYTDDQVVSSDFIGETCSTVFDASAGVMLNPKFVKLISWYDNEWGYSTRLVDLIAILAAKDQEA